MASGTKSDVLPKYLIHFNPHVLLSAITLLKAIVLASSLFLIGICAAIPPIAYATFEITLNYQL
jgi:hypothetical protein